MAKNKITRKDLVKSPDEFITFSSKVINFIRTHQQPTKYFGLAISLMVIVYLAVTWHISHINKMGQEAYNTAYSQLSENMDYIVDQTALKKAAESFLFIINEHGSSKAAKLASPQVAYSDFKEKKYKTAIEHYQDFIEYASKDIKSSSLSSLTKLAIVACYEAQGEFIKAIDVLNSIVRVPDDPFREIAMFSLERAYRLDNKPGEAKRVIKEFIKKYKTSFFLNEAKARLSL
jgi:tetratricopeptide (TPR) repeat protein